jgi:hypothetical protein
MNSSTARTDRGDFTLTDARREFCRHPSPPMIGATLVMALTARMVVADWRITDALVPAVTHRMGKDEGARNVLPLLTKHGYAGRLCR